MRRLAPMAAAALALACNRDLELPTKHELAITPALDSVAPREKVQFASAGGAGQVTYRWAAGSPLSGPGAALDPDTGDYQAGSNGSAVDAIEVVDGAGVVATARVTVTSRLSVTPPLGIVAPGGGVPFVASGGRPPYEFRLASAPSGGNVGASDGLYRAGSTGDVKDVVVVSDATADPAAVVTADVRVTATVRLYPGSASVAPNDTLAFVGLGGQPPYTFGVVSASGGSIDPQGVYVAGPLGSVTDRVVVTDSNGQTSSVDVSVGRVLSLGMRGTDVRPGATSPLVAQGGKPPYVFAFVARGNRSLGTVGEQTGDYVPGQNVGARDELMVTDAVGATALYAPGAVGALQVHLGIGAARCIPGDFNADGRGDALLVAEDAGFQFSAGRTFSLPEGGGAVEREVYLPPARVHDQVLVADFNGSGRDQLVFFGASGLWSLVPDASGALVFGPSLPASAFPPAAPLGTAAPAALVRGATVNRIVTSVPCTPGGGGNGLWRVDWTVGASAPAPAPVCEPVAWVSAPFAMAASDLNGDGVVDLAWVEQDGSNLSHGPLKVATGKPGGGFNAPLAYAFPLTDGVHVDAYIDPWWWGTPEMTLVATPLGIYVSLVPTGSPAHVTLLRAGTGGAAPAWAAGFPASMPFPVSGVAPRDATGAKMAAWSIVGQLAFFDVTATGPTVPLLSSAASPSVCAAFTDVNGDGVRDLVAGEAGASADDVLFADGGSRYGERPRFARSGPWASLGDLDGDGIGDVVVASGDRSLRVLFGGSGQLAYGPETTLDHPAVGIGAGDLGAPGPSAVVVDETGAVSRIPLDADGTAGAPAPLGTVSIAYMHPVRVTVHDFGGAPAGKDVLVVTENGDRVTSARYWAKVFRGGNGSSDAQSDLLYTEQWCDFVPAGASEVVALCVATDLSTLHLFRSVLSPGGWNTPWSAIAAPSLAGSGLRATLAGAGTLATGEALFVAAPSTTGTMPVLAVTVAPGGAVTITALPGANGPIAGVAMGQLDGSLGPDLVVAAGGEVRTFLATSTLGSYDASDLTAAPGSPGAVLPLRAAGTNDVLFATPDALVPLLGDGAGALQ